MTKSTRFSCGDHGVARAWISRYCEAWEALGANLLFLRWRSHGRWLLGDIFKGFCLLWTILKGNRRDPPPTRNLTLGSTTVWAPLGKCEREIPSVQSPHIKGKSLTGAGGSSIFSHETHLLSAVLSHPRSNAWSDKHHSLQVIRKSWLNRAFRNPNKSPRCTSTHHPVTQTTPTGLECVCQLLFANWKGPLPAAPLGRQGQTYYFSHKGLIIHSSNVDASSQCVEFFTSKFLSYKNAFRWKMLLTRKACGGSLNLGLGAFPFPSQRLHAQHWYWY